MTRVPVQFRLNGEACAEFVDSGTTLLALLRERAGDTSVKSGCGQGSCGSCSVLVDGVLKVSCLVLAEACDGREIVTTSGLADAQKLHPLQQAFLERFATQCGYCTPGMIMAAKALLDRNPDPTREEVIDAISGNICRCTGYEPIIGAILDAAQRSRSAATGE